MIKGTDFCSDVLGYSTFKCFFVPLLGVTARIQCPLPIATPASRECWVSGRCRRPGLRTSGVELSGRSDAELRWRRGVWRPKEGLGESEPQLLITYVCMYLRLKIKPRARCTRKSASLPRHLLKLVTRLARHII